MLLRTTLLRSVTLRPVHLNTRALSTATSDAAAPSAWRWAVAPWAFFIGENVVLSHNRSSIIAFFEEDESRYHMLYNALSTVACASLAFGYWYRLQHALPLRRVSGLAIGASFGLQALGLGGLAQALPRVQLPVTTAASTPPREPSDEPPPAPAARQWVIQCPMDFRGEATKEVTSPDGLHGLHRVSRHPLLWSLGAVGLGAALAVPSVPQALWLCGPAVMALIGGAHIDYRHRRNMGGTLTAEQERVTSLLPFVAMGMGAQAEGAMGSMRALVREVKAENAAIGALVAARWALGRGR